MEPYGTPKKPEEYTQMAKGPRILKRTGEMKSLS